LTEVALSLQNLYPAAIPMMLLKARALVTGELSRFLYSKEKSR
jgi:hypothetical protein